MKLKANFSKNGIKKWTNTNPRQELTAPDLDLGIALGFFGVGDHEIFQIVIFLSTYLSFSLRIWGGFKVFTRFPEHFLM